MSIDIEQEILDTVREMGHLTEWEDLDPDDFMRTDSGASIVDWDDMNAPLERLLRSLPDDEASRCSLGDAATEAVRKILRDHETIVLLRYLLTDEAVRSGEPPALVRQEFDQDREPQDGDDADTQTVNAGTPMQRDLDGDRITEYRSLGPVVPDLAHGDTLHDDPARLLADLNALSAHYAWMGEDVRQTLNSLRAKVTAVAASRHGTGG